MTSPIDGDHDQARVVARVAEAAALKLQGLTWAQVAEQTQYASAGSAYSAVMPWLRRQAEETITDLRDLTNARLERVMVALYPKAISGDLKAAAEYRRYLADFRRHNGLDAPLQVQISSGVEARLADVLADASKVVLGLVTESRELDDDEQQHLPPALEA